MRSATCKRHLEDARTGCRAPGTAIAAAAVALLLLAGCAGFESRPIKPVARDDAPSAAEDGIVYYLPLRPIIVQVVLDANSAMTITAPSVSAIPDRSRPYLLTVPDNGVGESHATIQIGTNGLLQSAATVQTSGADALAKAIAADLGTISGLAGRGVAAPAPAAAASCAPSKTYSRVIWPKEVAAGTPIDPICGLTVKLKKWGGNSPLRSTTKAVDYVNAQSGVFYKTEIPYLVTVEASAMEGQAFVAYSPDEAPIQFLPLKRSFFASNTTTFTLTDGLLTKSESDVGGEITGLAALPADIISAYMTALGGIFTSLNTNNTDKTSLAVSNARLQACRAAIAGNPIEGVSPSQIAINYAVIKAACGG